MFWVRKDEKYQNIKKLNFLDRHLRNWVKFEDNQQDSSGNKKTRSVKIGKNKL